MVVDPSNGSEVLDCDVDTQLNMLCGQYEGETKSNFNMIRCKCQNLLEAYRYEHLARYGCQNRGVVDFDTTQMIATKDHIVTCGQHDSFVTSFTLFTQEQRGPAQVLDAVCGLDDNGRDRCSKSQLVLCSVEEKRAVANDSAAKLHVCQHADSTSNNRKLRGKRFLE